VHGELARHFFYPQLARRKGWQGRVDLGFRVEADGRIERIRVVRSSGHGILDRSAMQALRDVGRLSVGTPKLGSHGWELDLPVIYRLREG
jgi:protein TonB